MLKVIFFDATGTLIHVPGGVGHHYQLVALRHGLELRKEWLDAAFRQTFKTMPLRPALRSPRPDDDKGWWRDLVDKVLDVVLPEAVASGESHQSFDRCAFFEDLYDHFARPGSWEAFPEVNEVLGELHGRFKLGIVSNFDGRLRQVLRNLELIDRFDPIVISSEAGADKPDPYIFERALELAGAAPEEALHVGDDAADWEGASAAGLHYFQLTRPKNSLTDLLGHLSDVRHYQGAV